MSRAESIGGKGKLKTGFTTGACAAAAAKAAASLLLRGVYAETVDIMLPAGERVCFPLHFSSLLDGCAVCSVKKFAGDDPDVTDGVIISARVQKICEDAIVLCGGGGVGVVTKPGLGLKVGAPAITEVPERMIRESVQEVLSAYDEPTGLRIEISAERGEEIALKTLNSRLGIVGGISILGTTGIVYPFSTEAYTRCIEYAMKVAHAAGLETVVITTGRRTENFARKFFDFPEEAFIQAGDFIGHSLKSAVCAGLHKVVIAAMPGKLVKISQGDFNTNVKYSLVDMQYLAGLAQKAGIVIPSEKINTVREIFELVSEKSPGHFVFSEICRSAALKSEEYITSGVENGCLKVEVIMFDYQGEVAGTSTL